jgi:hypothetical protein
MAKETGKQKTARIPLDYYKQGDVLFRSKRLLAAAAAVAAGFFALWGVPNAATHYSPGPVASIHAAWEADCNACHAPFVPIRDDAWSLNAVAGRTIDEKCQKCHPTPEHHGAARREDVAHCSSCHREHEGRNAQLARTSSQACTACHTDLAAHIRKVEMPLRHEPVANRVTSFSAGNHPEFRSIKNDPGKLKFSHRRHLAPGLSWGERKPKEPEDKPVLPLHVGDLAAADRERYRAPGAKDDLIRLNCQSCHEPAISPLSVTASLGSLSPGTLAPQSFSAETMAPVNFDRHCRACHALNYAPMNYPPKNWGDGPTPVVEHALPPARLKEYLEGVFARDLLEARKSAADEPKYEREIPGKLPDDEAQTLRATIQEKVRVADTFLRGRCNECHDLPGRPSETPIVPTNLRATWFAFARFDHGAHRSSACQDCHKPAAAGHESKNYLLKDWEPGGNEPFLDNADVLIPGIDNCLQCHNSRGVSGPSPVAARSDCVECHRYHGGDHRQELHAVHP